ncbi:hypothetical protein JNB_03665 [Janibacter sp. HTCC2649]|uniref:hypothetical protein n=1 Tax=Janibacter sp. HTCC2649 TaxID=313589 RepID=UPI000066ECAD|nr:hypothetical protein [Janibacter sp. HTCC2649]EAP99235.1 hypothetical protein JNB_03665 [Janibacter sp. HTCC2649]
MSPISEDELRARLRSVQPATARPGFAEQVVHQGRFRRRRQQWVAGIAAAAAVAVIGGGAFVISDQLGRETALPATPTPTPTQPEITPTVTSTKSPTATPTATPSPTNTPSTSTTRASSTPSPSYTPPRSVTLKPVTLLHQGNAQWVKSTFEGGLCVGEAAVIPEPQGYEELRVIWDTHIAGANRSEGIVIFPSAGDAVAYMDSVRAAALSCPDESSGQTKTLVQPLSGPWASGLAVAQSNRDLNYEEPKFLATGVDLFVRVGRAVTFANFSTRSELKDTIDPYLIDRSRPAIEHVVPQLCRYTKAGC